MAEDYKVRYDLFNIYELLEFAKNKITFVGGSNLAYLPKITNSSSVDDVRRALAEISKGNFHGDSELWDAIMREYNDFRHKGRDLYLDTFLGKKSEISPNVQTTYVDESNNSYGNTKPTNMKERFELFRNTVQIKTNNFKNNKGQRIRVRVGSALIAVVVAFSAGAKIGVDLVKDNLLSNVCIEYRIQYGDTLSYLEKEYDLKDLGFSHYEIEGFERQQAAKQTGQDIYDFIAEDDVIIARTTEENAQKMHDTEGAKIISIEDAVDKLSENHSCKGEFAKAASGESDVPFAEPSGKLMG